MDPLQTTLHYHERTKHAFQRYAPSLGYMDWGNQPDPFRRFEGASLIKLAVGCSGTCPTYDDLFSEKVMPPTPVTFESISAFFEHSLAISAWKEVQGSRWALRINPSSGNLHPTEGYLVVGPVAGLRDLPGVYHYAPKEHGLERRTEFSLDTWRQLCGGFPLGTFFVGLSSIHWREAWKYGERAYRYCQHDVGHAVVAVAISAAVQGWGVKWLDEMSDDQVASLLGLNRPPDFESVEKEHTDLLLSVIPNEAVSQQGSPQQTGDDTYIPVRQGAAHGLPSDAIAWIAGGTWTGSANVLSRGHVEWDIIDKVAEACRKPITTADEGRQDPETIRPHIAPKRVAVSAAKIIRQRRSAVAMDGRTSISAEQFFLILDRLMPRVNHLPRYTLGPPPCIHLGLFVHLVDGLDPGLYCLVRSPTRVSELRNAMTASFVWEKPPGCPESLPLFLLRRGDCRALAARLSCNQQIAGASAFSLGMIAEFEPRLREHGPWFYRRLLWEAGMIGQILYLEAEAAGVRGTGIGCFFDDPVHEIFGLSGRTFQSLYHFTVGGPVPDPRVGTSPPYPKH